MTAEQRGRRWRLLPIGASLLALLAVLSVLARHDSSTADPFFGLALPGAELRQLPAFADAVGCQPSVFAQFVKLDSPSFTVSSLDAISTAGMTPFLTLEPWSFRSPFGRPEQPQYALRTIVRGDHDRELRQIADVLAGYGRPVYLRFAHEMNAHWYPWGQANGNTDAEYVAAWRHVHEVLSERNPSISWVWSPAAVQQTRGTADLAALYPGDDYVDFVGVTGYARPGNADATVTDTVDRTLVQMRAFTQRPVILAEVGADGPRKMRWLASLGPFLRNHPQVRGLVYFNSSPQTTGATGHYALGRPEEFAQLRRSLSQARACGDGVGG